MPDTLTPLDLTADDWRDFGLCVVFAHQKHLLPCAVEHFYSLGTLGNADDRERFAVGFWAGDGSFLTGVYAMDGEGAFTLLPPENWTDMNELEARAA